MAFVPASNVLMVENRGQYLGIQIENTLYFQHTGAITAGDADDILEYMEIDLIPDLVSNLSNQLTYTSSFGTDLTSATAPTYTRVYSPAVTGSGVSAAMPGSVAACISFRTNGRGRSSRGRNYLCGLGENQVTANVLDSGTINALVGAYADMTVAGATLPANWEWVVLSRYLNGSARVSGLAQEITAVITTDYIVDSQRGRLR